MKTLYSERDYAYGATMLTLRTAIGLTQEGLADHLGVSRRTVGKWEAGCVYPKAEHLKKLILLAVKSQAFAVGHETEEIHALWKVARQKVLLDERWLSMVLDQRGSPHPYVEPPYGATEFATAEQAQGAVSTTVAGQAPCKETSALPTPAPPVKETISSALVKSGSLEDNEGDKEEDGAGSPRSSMLESLDGDDHSRESLHCCAQTPLQTSPDRLQKPPFVGGESEAGTIPAQTMAEKFLQRCNADDKTRGRRKLLMRVLTALVILTIISSAGTLFFHVGESTASTVQANKTPTAHAYPSYLSGDGTLAIFDPLNQEDDGWPTDKSDNTEGSCRFTAGAYHVSEQKVGNSYKCYTDTTFSNFAFEVQLTIMQGDCGGIIFRDKPGAGSYSFSICQNGMYRIRKHANPSDCTSVRRSYNSTIHAGLDQQNKIAVVAADDTMTFYVNEQQIDQIEDSSYTSGKIGLVAAPYHNEHGHATDVAYTNARVWIL